MHTRRRKSIIEQRPATMRIRIVSLALAIFASPVYADFSEALVAYQAGEFEVAYHQFLYAAQLGHAESQFNLGAMYVNGEFVDQDLPTAWAWLTLASRQGLESADAVLAQLEPYVGADERAEALERLSAFSHEALARSLLPDEQADNAPRIAEDSVASTQTLAEPGPEAEPGSVSPPEPALPTAPEPAPPTGEVLAEAVTSPDYSEVIPVYRVPPRYPHEAAIHGIEGTVRLRFTIDENGEVLDPEVLYSFPGHVFDREALRAVSRWRFRPRMVDGQPVRRDAESDIIFSLVGSSEIPMGPAAQQLVDEAMAGDSGSQFRLAQLMDYHPQLRDRRADVLDLVLRSAQGGNPDAQRSLSRMIATGDACTVDRAKADRWLHLSAEGGNTDSMVDIALTMRHADRGGAMRLLQRAVTAGDTDANLYLAAMLLQEGAGAEDVATARSLVEPLLDDRGSADHAYEVAALAAAYQGDWRRAVRWQSTAARRAHAYGGSDASSVDERLGAYQSRELPDLGFLSLGK